MGCIDFAEVSSSEYLRHLGDKVAAAGIPIKATVELTERCNLHCVHCYLGDQEQLRRQRAKELSTERWLGIIDEIADMGCLYLLMTGGDPMLRKDFAEIYAHAKRRGLLVTVFTNGTLVTDAILDLFRELPPFVIEITLYGATQVTYETVTGVSGSFERCMAGIDMLDGLGLDLRLKTILMKPNRHEFDRIAEICRSYSPDGKFRFDFEIHEGFGGDMGPHAVRLEAEDGVRLQMEQPEHAAGLHDYYARRRGLTPTRSGRLYSCGAGIGQFHINPYGQMQPCLTARHFTVNLAGETLASVLHAVRQRLMSARAPTGTVCTTCSERMVCHSCPAVAFLEKGLERGKSEYQCRVTRARSQLILSGDVLNSQPQGQRE